MRGPAVLSAKLTWFFPDYAGNRPERLNIEPDHFNNRLRAELGYLPGEHLQICRQPENGSLKTALLNDPGCLHITGGYDRAAFYSLPMILPRIFFWMMDQCENAFMRCFFQAFFSFQGFRF